MQNWPIPLLLALGLAVNLVAIWALDRSEAMTRPVQTAVVVVTILLAQKCFATIVHQDRARHVPESPASAVDGDATATTSAPRGAWSLGVTLGVVLVSLLIGSAAIGYFLGEDPAPTAQQYLGYALAVAGIVLVKLGG